MAGWLFTKRMEVRRQLAQDAALLAMNTVVDAYESALGKGVPPAILATAAVSSALGLMVQIQGEEAVIPAMDDAKAGERVKLSPKIWG